MRLQGNKWFGFGAVTLVGLLIGKTLMFDISVHKAFVSERRESERALNEFLQRQGRTSDSVILYGWRTFVPAFTVRFMNQGEGHIFNAAVEAAFPREGLFNGWPNELCFPVGKSTWDFIVVGVDYEQFVDPAV